MILEAQQIYESLCDANWSINIAHGDLYKPGKEISIRVELSNDGKSVSSIHFLDKETTVKYWTLGDNNKNRFPVSKLEVNTEMKQVKSKDIIKEWKAKKLEVRTDELKCWVNEYFPEGQLAELDSTLKKRLHDRSESLEKLSTTKAKRFLDLLNIFEECTEEQYNKWVGEILGRLKSLSFGESKDTILAQNILVTLAYTARPPKGSKDKNEAAVTVIWDLEKKGLNGMQATSPIFYNDVNKALLENENQPNDVISVGVGCSITGDNDIEKKIFPNPSLASLGPTRLYSRNKATESLKRYGQSGSAAFPISHNHVAKLAAALSSLTTPDKEDKTWTKITSPKTSKTDLLLVYQSSLINEQFASAIGTDQRQNCEAGFEELCKRLVERTKGRTTNQIRGKLFIAVLRALDTANTKVVFHKNLNIENFESAAILWQEACINLIGLKLYIPTEKEKSMQLVGQPILNPGSLPSLTKTFHFLDGRSSESPGGISFKDSMQLLLTIQAPDSKLVNRCLAITLRRLGPLLQRTASLKYRTSPKKLEFKTEKTQNEGNLRWNILKAQSLFSLLITSSNRTPQQVMKSIAYQLGQLCAAYDQIHAGYCHQERGGDLPPKLLGNICFQSANRNPTAALSQLSQRAAPHLAWVKRAKKVESSGDKFTEAQWAVIHAKSASKNLKENSESIHSALLNNEAPLDDLFRAELVLGYLAGYPKKEQSTEKETQKNK